MYRTFNQTISHHNRFAKYVNRWLRKSASDATFEGEIQQPELKGRTLLLTHLLVPLRGLLGRRGDRRDAEVLLLVADECCARRGAVLGRGGDEHRVGRLGVHLAQVGVEQPLQDQLGVVAQLFGKDRYPLPSLV